MIPKIQPKYKKIEIISKIQRNDNMIDQHRIIFLDDIWWSNSHFPLVHDHDALYLSRFQHLGLFPIRDISFRVSTPWLLS